VASGGVLAVAAVSGLTDVDAMTLSSDAECLNSEALPPITALTAVGIAVGSNLVFKAVMCVDGRRGTAAWSRGAGLSAACC